MAKKTSKLGALVAFDEAISAGLPEEAILVGVDEVGRGSCIGPVSAGAVAFPSHLPTTVREKLNTLNDSKQMKASDRTQCCTLLEEHCVTAYAEASQAEVDTINVYQASLLAASRALLGVLEQLPTPAPIHLLLDGRGVLPEAYWPTNHPNCESFTQQAIIKGDGKSFSIAGASVIAKHRRDGLIQQWAMEDPRYGWATNMGYPTPAHKAALKEHGPSPYHRQSYKLVQEAFQSTLLPIT